MFRRSHPKEGESAVYHSWQHAEGQVWRSWACGALGACTRPAQDGAGLHVRRLAITPLTAGLVDAKADDLEEAAGVMERLLASWSTTRPTADNEAKQVAADLQGKVGGRLRIGAAVGRGLPMEDAAQRERQDLGLRGNAARAGPQLRRGLLVGGAEGEALRHTAQVGVYRRGDGPPL